MADAVLLPRFFKVYVSHLSSDSMQIPVAYYEKLPSHLHKRAILQGPSGGSWNVGVVKKKDDVYFAKGWIKFVEDNRLCDGDFLTFVFNGDRIFEVSIYRHDGCKDVQEEAEAEDKEDRILLGDTETENDTESEMIKKIPRSNNKGKLKQDVSHGDNESDEDYIEAFGRLDVSEDSNNSDTSYSPSIEIEYPIGCAKQKKKNSNKKGKSKIIEDAEEESSDSASFGEPLKKGKRSEKAKCKIKNPEAYLDNPRNVHLETSVKNRPYELLVHAQLVKDYDLKFEEKIKYIDRFGKLDAKTATWGDGRVVIKKWIRICERNKLKKQDGILCEFFRKNDMIYAVKIHIIRAKDL